MCRYPSAMSKRLVSCGRERAGGTSDVGDAGELLSLSAHAWEGPPWLGGPPVW